MIDIDLNVDAYAKWLYSLGRAIEGHATSDIVGGYDLLVKNMPSGILIFIPTKDEIELIEAGREILFKGKVQDFGKSLDYPVYSREVLIGKRIDELKYKYQYYYQSIDKEPISVFSDNPEGERKQVILGLIQDLATYDTLKLLLRLQKIDRTTGYEEIPNLESESENEYFISHEYEGKALSVMLKMGMVDQNYNSIMVNKGSSILTGFIEALIKKEYTKKGVQKLSLFKYLATLIKFDGKKPPGERYPIANETKAEAMNLL